MPRLNESATPRLTGARPRTGALVIFTAVCLAPLSMLRSMDSLQITSGVATVCILYAAAVIIGTPPPAEAETPPPVAFNASSASLLSLPCAPPSEPLAPSRSRGRLARFGAALTSLPRRSGR